MRPLPFLPQLPVYALVQAGSWGPPILELWNLDAQERTQYAHIVISHEAENSDQRALVYHHGAALDADKVAPTVADWMLLNLDGSEVQRLTGASSPSAGRDALIDRLSGGTAWSPVTVLIDGSRVRFYFVAASDTCIFVSSDTRYPIGVSWPASTNGEPELRQVPVGEFVAASIT